MNFAIPVGPVMRMTMMMISGEFGKQSLLMEIANFSFRV